MLPITADEVAAHGKGSLGEAIQPDCIAVYQGIGGGSREATSWTSAAVSRVRVAGAPKDVVWVEGGFERVPTVRVVSKGIGFF